MATKAEQYAGKLEEFLKTLGVTSEYFCDQQRERWLALAKNAYNEAEATASAPAAAATIAAAPSAEPRRKPAPRPKRSSR